MVALWRFPPKLDNKKYVWIICFKVNVKFKCIGLSFVLSIVYIELCITIIFCLQRHWFIFERVFFSICLLLLLLTYIHSIGPLKVYFDTCHLSILVKCKLNNWTIVILNIQLGYLFRINWNIGNWKENNLKPWGCDPSSAHDMVYLLLGLPFCLQFVLD